MIALNRRQHLGLCSCYLVLVCRYRIAAHDRLLLSPQRQHARRRKQQRPCPNARKDRGAGPVRSQVMGLDPFCLSRPRFATGGRVFLFGRRPIAVAAVKAQRVGKQSDAKVSPAISGKASARCLSVVESFKGWPRFITPLLTAFAVRCGGLLALLGLTACEPGIVPSKGIVGKATTTILIDSLAIMLAIVVPTIVAA